MNIAILIGLFSPGVFGGAEIQAEQWAKRLSDRHRVTVLTRRHRPDLPEREPRDGFTVIRLPVSGIPVWRSIADLAGIRAAVGRLDPRPDVLLCFQTFVSGLAGTLAGASHGVPAVVWIRGEEEYQLGRSRRHRFVNPRVWRAARGVLVQSEENRRQLLAELGQSAPRCVAQVRDRVAVIPNGLELPPPGRRRPGARALSVGRLIPNKCMDVLIDSAAAAGVPLAIAGDGPERGRLAAQAAALGLDCRFEGIVARDRLATLYEEAVCMVLASRRGEGLSNALLEAMSYGLPVIATPCAGARDLIEDGRNGLIVPFDDRDALAAALARLRADPALAARLGEQARASVERFAWGRVRPLLEDALERWSRR